MKSFFCPFHTKNLNYQLYSLQKRFHTSHPHHPFAALYSSNAIGVPAAGFVAGIASNLVANWRATRTKIDDSLDVFACHGVAGIWGALATGLFASAAVNKVNGLFFGNPMQLAYQAIAVAVVALYAFIGSYLLLKGLSFVMNIRVSKEEEDIGLDKSQHQEEAYT